MATQNTILSFKEMKTISQFRFATRLLETIRKGKKMD
jgi:hypothetical protein